MKDESLVFIPSSFFHWRAPSSFILLPLSFHFPSAAELSLFFLFRQRLYFILHAKRSAFILFFQWIRSKFANAFGHGLRCAGVGKRLTAGHKEYIQPFASQPDLVENLFGALQTRVPAFVAAHVMAVAKGTSHHVHPVRTLLESLQQIAHVRFA